MTKRTSRISSWEGLSGTTSDVWQDSSKSVFFVFFVFQFPPRFLKCFKSNHAMRPFYHKFTDFIGPFFLDFGIFLILGATGHGCSAEGTDAVPRAHGPGALGSQPVSADGNNKNQIASRFDFFLYYFVLTWYGVI